MILLDRFAEMINTHSLANAHELIAEDIVEEAPIVLDAPHRRPRRLSPRLVL